MAASFDLDGRVVIVTGGLGQLGASFANALVGAGARVAVLDVSDDRSRAKIPLADVGEERLRLFLIQYWGGPQTYSRQRGHPRLRMRHAPFAINEAARDAWLRHMRAAVDSLELPPAYEQTLWAYLSGAADQMRNTPG